MKSFLKTKSVTTSLAGLLDEFCKKNHLISPKKTQSSLNDHITFGEWLKKIKTIDKQYPHEGLGLDMGRLFQPNHIGVVAYIAQSSNTLSDYIQILPKYEKLWFNYLPKKIRVETDTFSISWEKPSYLQAGIYIQESKVVEEMHVAIIYQQFKQLLDDEENIFLSLELAIPEPKDLEKYMRYFKCPIQFNTEQTKIILSSSLLHIPFKSHDPNLLTILTNHANTLLKKMPKQDSLRELVNLSILRALESSDVKIQTIAKSLNTSPRLLQIDLKKNGLSFRNILNSIRQSLAKKYLKNCSLLIVDIAFLLGYKDQTSFNRAFKAWTGISPSEWRKRHIDKNMNAINPKFCSYTE
ncbi:AraC family transcriptional regulator ligand-binding domain-containing protein [Acinetobacter bereziniae]|uniref:HTH araC/xylS-type domain-containing protein n=1 Tax=Acinetobacter bereziniae LMG 1003 = CIP 70.12 TaxID=981324 RepID=N9D2C3_ACIBZ|nr:AraC family transcriptional regulator [Acinetobacter bereziniae]ENV91986.1 hypothetical protein F938_03118 [Acinetobacter bereziniae LMG 1003 = CIP 70.12]MBJ9908761.1 AraC family transcriptional regulator ligand-binding domain-containing protein [Acinetobacter bereziniae]MBJ9930675.1 AraC family transcriptional regulator ligand-binding domain-containing protein [Acinetobacter bereziniae]MDG3557517.1 AraC family transcriptional regulator ligand-binding domain-containing protein [Acinetobacter